ncbi:hypothetical protein FB451DRAFT_1188299 [Mycena latifolia]|nr:hypothetical protein FB451DRAFT_1188299 [Mycena latifolia]
MPITHRAILPPDGSNSRDVRRILIPGPRSRFIVEVWFRAVPELLFTERVERAGWTGIMIHGQQRRSILRPGLGWGMDGWMDGKWGWKDAWRRGGVVPLCAERDEERPVGRLFGTAMSQRGQFPGMARGWERLKMSDRERGDAWAWNSTSIESANSLERNVDRKDINEREWHQALVGVSRRGASPDVEFLTFAKWFRGRNLGRGTTTGTGMNAREGHQGLQPHDEKVMDVELSAQKDRGTHRSSNILQPSSIKDVWIRSIRCKRAMNIRTIFEGRRGGGGRAWDRGTGTSAAADGSDPGEPGGTSL